MTRLMLDNFKDRLRAMSIHFIVSLILGGGTLLLVYKVWYPWPLDKAVGVTNILVLMLVVDVLIGPLLTFMVFDRRKASLRIDLMVVVVMQLGAFFYGIYTVAQGRPAWLVFNVDRFDLVRAYEIDNREIISASEDFQSAPWFGPKWVGAKLPLDAKTRGNLLQESLSGGSDLAQRPQYYVPLDTVKSNILERSRKSSDLLALNGRFSLHNLMSFNEIPEFLWLPLMASNQPMVVIVNKHSDELKIEPLRPW